MKKENENIITETDEENGNVRELTDEEMSRVSGGELKVR